MKRFCLILLLTLALSLPSLACGSSAGPAEAAEPAESPIPLVTSTPAPTPTLSSAEHVEQGLAYIDEENQDSAIAEFQNALEMEPENVEAHTNLGMVYLDQALYTEAAAEFETVLAIEPDHVTANGGLCVAYALVKPEMAEEICQTALEQQPDNADIYNGMGITLAQHQRFDEAVTHFETAIFLEPEHVWAHNNLGYTYIFMDRLDEAVEELKLAVQITPENALAFNNLGIAYAQMGDYEQALPAYEEALRLDPNLVNAYYDLGLIYRDLGQAEMAISNFEKYLELYPNGSDRASVENMIAELQYADLAPGTYVEFDKTINAESENDINHFSLFTSPAAFFGVGEDTIELLVQPQDGLDISISLLDSSTGDNKLVVEVDEAGPGEAEYLTATLPETDSTIGVYTISIIANDGSGTYHASLSGSPAVGFFISDDWEVKGMLDEMTAVFFVISALGSAGEPISLEVIPRQEDNLDLFITAIDTTGNQNLGTLNETSVGEAESDMFTPDSSVYLFIVGEQEGNPGQIKINYDK